MTTNSWNLCRIYVFVNRGPFSGQRLSLFEDSTLHWGQQEVRDTNLVSLMVSDCVICTRCHDMINENTNQQLIKEPKCQTGFYSTIFRQIHWEVKHMKCGEVPIFFTISLTADYLPSKIVQKATNTFCSTTDLLSLWSRITKKSRKSPLCGRWHGEMFGIFACKKDFRLWIHYWNSWLFLVHWLIDDGDAHHCCCDTSQHSSADFFLIHAVLLIKHSMDKVLFE